MSGIRDRIISLRRVPAHELQPNPANWRRHPAAQRRALEAMLGDIGYADALLAREDDAGRLVLIDGHLRAETTPNQEVPVLVLDLTEAEAATVLATLDPLAAMADVDSEALKALLDEVSISSEDLLRHLSGIAGSPAGRSDGDADDAPAAPLEAQTQLGELWICGRHRVLCGDGTDLENVTRACGDLDVHALLTDPPYGISLDTDYRKMNNKRDTGLLRGTPSNLYRPIEGDDTPFDPAPLMNAWASVKEAWLFGADYYCTRLPGVETGSWLVWDKRSAAEDEHFGGGSDEGFGSGFELIWSQQRHKRRVLRHFWFGAFGSRGEASKRHHPTQKPTALLEEILERWTPEACVIADPYAGSGSTLIACERLGRTAVCIEIDPLYVDVIVQRWETFTGERAHTEAGARMTQA